jgi:hypothetical protein
MDLLNELEKNNMIFIYGNVYNGKFNQIKNEINDQYQIYEYDYIDFYYKKNWEKILEHMITKDNISFFFQKIKKKILIIKEVEIIEFTKIKNILKILGLKNKKIKNFIKIILIGSGQCIKQKKNLSFFKIIKYDNDENYEDNNKKKFLKKNNFKKKIYKNNFNNELYENLKKIFCGKMVKYMGDIYFNNKILLPLLIHENYKTFLKKNIKNQLNLRKSILEISKHILNIVEIDEYIYRNRQIYALNLYYKFACEHISYMINFYQIKKNPIDINMKYTKILIKNSIKSYNIKNYISIFNQIKIIHNFDYTYLNYIHKILLIHLTNNNINYYKEIKKIGYEKKDFIKIIRNSNEYYFIRQLEDLKNML